MQSILIPIHSFVDLITNSSSEVFVEATEKTVETVKDIINEVLKLQNSSKTADDLFSFTLVMNDDRYNEETNKWKVRQVDISTPEGKELYDNGMASESGAVRVELKVTSKIESPDIKPIMDMLVNLHNTYKTTSVYN